MSESLITVVACPDQAEGTDPEASRLAFHRQSPTSINAYCHAAAANWLIETDVGVMKRLGQGGLRSPSASFSFCTFYFSRLIKLIAPKLIQQSLKCSLGFLLLEHLHL